MKALTVKQPWAALILAGGKDVENRTRRTSYHGRLAIHVANSASHPSGHLASIHEIIGDTRGFQMRRLARENPNAGLVIGTVDLVDCVRDSSSPWAFPDHWHWVLGNPQPFDEPIPAKGRLGLWEWKP